MKALLQQFSRHRVPLLLAAAAMLLSLTYTYTTPFRQPLLPESRVWLTGQIADVQNYAPRTRLLLRNVSLYGLHAPVTQLEKVRLSLPTARWEKLELSLGDGFAAQAMLQPIPLPDFPGDYDPTQQAALSGLAATGYVMGEVAGTTITQPPTWWDRVTQFRRTLATYVSQQASPLAAALLTGLRDNLPQPIKENFRHAGLAHLLAISGLHLGMVAGMVFFALRYAFTLWPRLALTLPTKQIAAIAALLAGGGYMLLAGATIPTVRAFIMLSLLLLAVFLHRQHISLRLWALAVVIVLLLWPASVITPSFQMSFAATLALILWAIPQPENENRWHQAGYINGIFTASLLAGLATLPLAAAHFGTVSFSGFLLNLLAIPLMGFWILPAGLIALLLMPLGWDQPALWVMQHGLNVLTHLAAWGDTGWFGQWLGGWRVPRQAWPVLAVISLLGIGGMVLHRKRWAIIAIALAAVTCALWPKHPPADVIVLDNGSTVVLCPQANQCSIVQATETDRTWQRLFRVYHLMPTQLPAICDGTACTYQLHGQTLLLTDAPTPEDCTHANLILSPYTLPSCPVIVLQPGQPYTFINLPHP